MVNYFKDFYSKFFKIGSFYFSSVPMNLLYVAKASNHCQAFFMTIMYTELWALSESTSNDNQSKVEEHFKNPAFQEVAIKVILINLLRHENI